MKYHKALFITVAIALITAGFGLTRALTDSASTTSSELPLQIIKQWNDSGKCELFWANGLAAVSGTGYKITRIDTDGRVKSVINTNWMVRAESIHCKDAVVIGQFLAKYKGVGVIGHDSTRGFPGLIDLQTGQHVKLASGDKATLFLNTVAYRHLYWSSDYQTFLGRLPLNADPDKREKRLVLIHQSSPDVTEWSPANGGYPSSWVWSDDDGRRGFWILTNRPGALYHLENNSKEKLKIPALDNAPIEMLSPKLDRAIAFHKSFSDGCWASDGYWVDFTYPDREKQIATSECTNIRNMCLGWGAWSPDGKQIALLLLDRSKSDAFQLYVGDPAKRLKKAGGEGLRFSNENWVSEGELEGLPGPGSIVWDANSRYLYCRMINEKKTCRGHYHYVIVKIDTES